jgi:gliding motility-associated-like protein
MCPNGTKQLTNSLAGGTWTSDAPSVADVVNGLVTAFTQGTATITYSVTNTCGTDSKTFGITVNAAPPVVDVITGTSTICPNTTTQLADLTAGGTWTSNAIAIATVSPSGLVTGIKSGSATITYKVTNSCGTDSKSIVITVSPAAPIVPAIIGSTAAMCPNGTKQLTNSLAGGTWTSDNNSSATVSTTGLVTAVAQGTATITYTVTNSCGTDSKTFPITVNAAPPVVDVITGTSTICPNTTTQLADLTAGGTWTSNAIAIATVSPSGLVTGIKSGSATITYRVTNSCGTDSKSIVITVSPAAPIVPAIIGSTAAMCPNGTKQLTNSLAGGTWTSDNNSSATVSTTGLVTAVAQGTATITYTVTNSCGTDSKTFPINVNAAPPVVDVITGTTTICPNTTTQLADLTTGGIWSSNVFAIATVSPSTGLVTGVKSGNATITYKVTNSCGSDSKSILVTVSPAAPVVPAITGSTAAMCPNGTKQLTNSLAGGTWSSNSIGIADVSPTGGLVNAVAQGTATITYTVTNSCGTDSKTFAITVNAAPPIVDVITGNTTICPGVTTQLADLTTGGTWVSNNTLVATVDATGLVTGVKSGTATITYKVTNSCGSDSKSIVITVSPAAPVVPTITGNTTICPTKTTTLRNTLAGGIWTSSDINIATVGSNNGFVTGIAQGSATITYTVTNSCGADSKSITVIVSPPAPIVPAITGITTICPSTTTQLSNTLSGGVWTSSNATILQVSPLGFVTGTTSGTASVTYTVTNSCGSNSNSIVVTVDPAAPKVPAITGSNKVCPNKTIALNNTLAGGVWSSNDLTVATVANTGVVSGVAQGTAIITYTVTNSCGVDSKQFTVTVNAPIPVVPAITGSSNLCPNTTAQLANALSGGVWKSSNSGIASVSSAGLVTALSSGLTTISYIVTNSCGADTSTLSLTVIKPKQTYVHIKADTNTICSGGSVTFKVDSSSNGGNPLYQWTKNNLFVFGATTDTFSTSGLNNGDVINCLFTSSLACVTGTNVFSNNIKITVKPNLVPSISIKTNNGQSGVDTICKGSPIEFSATTLNGGTNPLFQWKVNGFDTLGNASNSKLVLSTLSDNDMVSCVLKSSEGCLASNYPISNLIKVVVIDKPSITNIVSTGSVVCYNGVLQLSNLTPNGTWSSSSPNYATVSSNGLVSGVAAGNTTINYVVGNSGKKCFYSTASINIAVEGKPYIEPINASASSICKGDSILFTNNVDKGYWKSIDTNIAKVDSAKGWVLGRTTGYDSIEYIIKGYCGISEVAKQIYVSGKKPISRKAEIITKPTCLYPLTGNVKVSVNGYSNESPYQFTFNSNTYTAPYTLYNLGVNLYPITIYNNIGCIVDSIPDFILPYNSDANCDTLYVPSGFIPTNNGGSKNHTLKPFGGGYLQSLSFKVFNRLGNMVFESNDINSGWDGTMNGKLQDAGTYIWFLEYKQANGVVRQSKGVSVLIK